MFPTAHRHVGVAIPEGQAKEPTNLPELTVTSVNKLEFFGITYVEKAKLTPALVVRDVEGNLYLAPNGDAWVKGLRPLSDKLTNNVKDTLARLEGTPLDDVPAEDNVDVIAEEMAAEEVKVVG